MMNTNELLAPDVHAEHGLPRLDPAERELLLDLARVAITAAATGAMPPRLGALSPALTAPGAAFVTIHAQGKLRGCIGCLEPRGSLAGTVLQMARAAALDDPRFSPLSAAELDRVSVEISVLGPLVPVSSIDEVEVGRDGLVVDDRDRRGLLLPQVADEHHWDRETFASHTCLKAGLAPDAWRSGARLFRFTADVFGTAALR